MQNRDMADSASETITIQAPADRVWAVAANIDAYPSWVHDVKDVNVRSVDDQGRPTEVEFRASALGRSTHYVLRYDYTNAPNQLSWTMVSGDIQRSIDGSYTLNSLGESVTEVRYDLEIDLAVPLPGFVKRRAERRILNAVHDMKAVAEA